MLKTPRFLLTASLALALVFTFSCSGDDGDDPPVTLPSSSDSGVSQLPSSPSVAPSSSSEDAALSSSSNDEELVEVSSSSEEESSSSAAPPPYIPPYNPPYIPPVTPSSSSLAHSSSSLEHCSHFREGTEIEHYGIFKEKFCDKRDGNEYVKVPIGTETWMAENLNYAAEGSRCYDDDEAKCKEYGRLYDWATAMGFDQECNTTDCTSRIQQPHQGICPEGWHMPASFTPLQNFIIAENIIANQRGNVLKAKEVWPYEWNGIGMWVPPDPELTDKYGFSALPAGAYVMVTTGAMPTKGYADLGIRTNWWYGVQASGQAASVKFLYNSREDSPAASTFNKTNFFSVRCIKD